MKKKKITFHAHIQNSYKKDNYFKTHTEKRNYKEGRIFFPGLIMPQTSFSQLSTVAPSFSVAAFINYQSPLLLFLFNNRDLLIW